MEDNKYYTPEIEEFRVGFEYELFKDSEWFKTMVYNHSIGKDINIEIKDMGHWQTGLKPRVKYLDKEDIESLGWIKTIHKTVECFKLNNNYLFHFNESNIFISIDVISEINTTQLFRGVIKNKSELKKLMQQFNIK